MSAASRHRLFLVIELLSWGILVPLLVMALQKPVLLFPLLWTGCLVSLWWLRRCEGMPLREIWAAEAVNWQNLRPLLRRFTLNAVLLMCLTLWLRPEAWFGFPQEKPQLWALVMLCYPWISALPQEILYRVLLCRRYQPLAPAPHHMLLLNGAVFGLSHMIFQNWVAVLLCLLGGVLFTSTYQRQPSLALVTLEHALYGCLLFTIGLGQFFYHGAVGAG